MYMDYLSKIAVFTAGINSTCIFIVGDFNADLSKTSPFGSILCDFCHDNSFTIADKEYLPADTYTYVSSAWGTTLRMPCHAFPRWRFYTVAYILTTIQCSFV